MEEAEIQILATGLNRVFDASIYLGVAVYIVFYSLSCRFASSRSICVALYRVFYSLSFWLYVTEESPMRELLLALGTMSLSVLADSSTGYIKEVRLRDGCGFNV